MLEDTDEVTPADLRLVPGVPVSFEQSFDIQDFEKHRVEHCGVVMGKFVLEVLLLARYLRVDLSDLLALFLPVVRLVLFPRQ